MATLEPTGSIECDACCATAAALEGWVTGVYRISEAEGDYAMLSICPDCVAQIFLTFAQWRDTLIGNRANDVAWLRRRHGSVRIALSAHFAAATTEMYAGEWGQVWRPEQNELEWELLEIEHRLERHGVNATALRQAEDADRPSVSMLLERLRISGAPSETSTRRS